MDMKQTFSTWSFVGGFMIGLLFAGVWFAGHDFSSISPAPQASLSDNLKKTFSESGILAVSDQPAGNEVVVASVTVPPPGVWIAVREISGADLGNVLGAARVNGPRTAVTIPLLRATDPGLPYVAELYRDDGGSEFDPARNSVYIDFTTGSAVIAHFTTTAN